MDIENQIPNFSNDEIQKDMNPIGNEISTNNEYLMSILNQCKYFGDNCIGMQQEPLGMKDVVFQTNPSIDVGFQKNFIDQVNSDLIHQNTNPINNNFHPQNTQSNIGSMNQNNNFLDNSDRFGNND